MFKERFIIFQVGGLEKSNSGEQIDVENEMGRIQNELTAVFMDPSKMNAVKQNFKSNSIPMMDLMNNVNVIEEYAKKKILNGYKFDRIENNIMVIVWKDKKGVEHKDINPLLKVDAIVKTMKPMTKTKLKKLESTFNEPKKDNKKNIKKKYLALKPEEIKKVSSKKDLVESKKNS